MRDRSDRRRRRTGPRQPARAYQSRAARRSPHRNLSQALNGRFFAMTRGSCLCGGVAFEAGDPIELRNCHCSRCRKARGAAFAANLFVPAGAFRWTPRRRSRDQLSAAEHATIWKFVLPYLRQSDAACGSDSRGRADSGGRARRRPKDSHELSHLRRLEGSMARDHRRPAATSRRSTASLTRVESSRKGHKCSSMF